MASNPATPAATPAAPATPAQHGSGHDAGHGAHSGQQHPIGLYLKIWLLLFVLSALSYMVDYFHVSGYLRWTLILLFMGLKAGLIVAVFMHMAWERMALICAILIPPLCLLVLVWLMAEEANHTFLTRGIFFR
ncbi:cytochrome C oxidase subunit IV family protein [Cupriavidus taiwanensis]|uniref:Bb3-type cytochrome oxidase subunit IV n=1 Tax=Cupriavidus taiwanensis TaxID=164546 RepID=A0A375CCF0_9BURK|nr:cytochrome C oxidase subunit IV family protein [Cupriavidus taiwanensis]NSX13514.1 cytochrome C oxidase subunit IV family protein [Cupriavidus taiwanensis]SOY67752.1 bb3-type cytochrome oxidase subunit IV [Cupriavidus taiwanensis]